MLKSEVYYIAKELNINNEIIDAPPTDGLWDNNQNDEEQIGASYNELEWAMGFNKDSKNLSKRKKEVLQIYNKLNKANQHKMNAIPICKIPKNLK